MKKPKLKFSGRPVDSVKIGDVWRHLKRQVDYKILNIHKDSDDDAITYVIYQAIHSNNVYARRIEYFLSYDETLEKFRFIKIHD